MIGNVNLRRFRPSLIPSEGISQHLYVHLNAEYLGVQPQYFSRSLVCVSIRFGVETLHTFIDHVHYRRFIDSLSPDTSYIWLRIPTNQYYIPKILK